MATHVTVSRILCILFAVSCFTALNRRSWGQTAPPSPPRALFESKTTIRLNASSKCAHNILRLKDIADVQGSTASSKRLAELPIAPTPPAGRQQEWSRSDVEKALQLRGVDVSTVQWEGAPLCRVNRVAATQIVDRPPPDPNILPASAVRASGTIASEQKNAPNLATDAMSIDDKGFVTAFTTPGAVAQAERIAQTAIENYLQTQTQSSAEFLVKPILPPNLAQTILQRRQIIGIAGGQPPYEGLQSFEFLVRSPTGQEKITVHAEIKLPELILVCTKALPKGHWIRAEDLTYQTLPRGWKDGIQNCYTDQDELIGKELKRGVSANQVLKRGDAGAPTLVESGDAVKIELVLGGVVIETNGRAVESGGQDDLIQVETAEHKKRLLARVRSERVVEVYSSGHSPLPPSPSLSSKSKPRMTR
ncbi:flagellar basal body P-ring biosynthesis protein FlgA [Pirellula sp. SH-Sr6A]|uniref:flagellar basal body P-ring formation chaperone FlgA n=1 Tax=Pirellula sp. SH-Sr6A TaxID=1632865 RepID=UPI00078C3973|nr:flagellar basal body P-ring formation chaperone FlgA [Pirellula sp. SH-Sr6A]AMV33859.1 flagellar basal body P-ring biosynthesis protein FlgA [Pirellula sp. SH-Sr6A]